MDTLDLDAYAGFLGVNGSGKSSLMRILAGVDKEFEGNIFLADGIRIGYLEQEPKLDAGPTVDENIRPALAHMQELINEYEEVAFPTHGISALLLFIQAKSSPGLPCLRNC